MNSDNFTPKLTFGFTNYLINIISKYYNRPYLHNNKECTLYRKINNIDYKVYRYNHGLIYGIRQAFLAKSIVYLNYKTNNNFGNWLRYNYKNDHNFIYKIMFASAFQRAGRESEGSSGQLGKLYLKYEKNDAEYFEFEARKSNLFDNREINVYKQAILWEANKSNNITYLKNILHAAHLLDLRRMPFFDSQRIKKEVVKLLFGSSEGISSKNVVGKLFDISGSFLYATGDRDMMKEKKYVNDKFFILSNNNRLLSDVMNDTFTKIYFTK